MCTPSNMLHHSWAAVCTTTACVSAKANSAPSEGRMERKRPEPCYPETVLAGELVLPPDMHSYVVPFFCHNFLLLAGQTHLFPCLVSGCGIID